MPRWDLTGKKCIFRARGVNNWLNFTYRYLQPSIMSGILIKLATPADNMVAHANVR